MESQNLDPDKLTELVRETVWKLFEESGRISQASTTYNSRTYVKHRLPSCSTSQPLRMLDGLIVIIQLRTSALPTLGYRILCPALINNIVPCVPFVILVFRNRSRI